LGVAKKMKVEVFHRSRRRLNKHTLFFVPPFFPHPSSHTRPSPLDKMKVVDKMKASMADGKTFFSFEYFPPRTEEVSFFLERRAVDGVSRLLFATRTCRGGRIF
jgi:hypothetical protein